MPEAATGETPARRPVRKLVVGALVAVNALLAGSLLTQSGSSPEPQAKAANANALIQQVRRPGDYLAIGGDVGQSTAVVYVLDTTNGELTALAYDDNNNRLQAQRPIRLEPIFDAALQQQQQQGRGR